MRRKIIAVIQARIGSTRLPCKMMLSLHGRPIIEWVVRRVQKARLLDGIVVAIPDTEDNKILANYLERLHVDYFCGPEDDVLKRFLLAAERKNATHVVRVCADNPLISGGEIDNLIRFYENNSCDYAYNHIPKGNTYPDGLGAEIVSFKLLRRLEQVASRPEHREHCHSYITEHPEKFTIKTFDPPDPSVAHPEVKLDIDTFEDYRRLALMNFNLDSTPSELIKIFTEQL